MCAAAADAAAAAAAAADADAADDCSSCCLRDRFSSIIRSGKTVLVTFGFEMSALSHYSKTTPFTCDFALLG